MLSQKRMQAQYFCIQYLKIPQITTLNDLQISKTNIIKTYYKNLSFPVNQLQNIIQNSYIKVLTQLTLTKAQLAKQIKEKGDGLKKNQKNFFSHSQRLSCVSIIAGVSNFGQFFYTINYGKNNSETFIFFMKKLIFHLDKQNKRWREKTVVLIDNAPYHRSLFSKEFYQKNQMPVMFLGPYQYRMAPIELMFAYIKSKDFNPLKIKGETKNQIKSLLKEIAIQMSRFETHFIKDLFFTCLQSALECLCLKDL